MDSSSSHSPDLFDDPLSRATQGRLRAEEALRHSEELHRSVLRTAMDGYWMVNQKGRLVEVNEAYCRMSGYSESELLGMSVAHLEGLEQPRDIEDRMRAIVMRGTMRFESIHIRKDGSRFPVEISVQYNPEIPHHLVVFLRDITDRNQALRLRQESERKLREAQRIAHLGWWELDHSSGHLEWSDEIFRIFELERDHFGASYQAFLDRVHPDDRPLVDQAYRKSLQDRQPYDISHRLLFANGRVKHVQERCETTYASDGTPLCSLGTVQDITAQTVAEEDRVRLRGLLDQAQRMESVGRLAGGVAHDFNNMLCVIIGRAEEALGELESGVTVGKHLEEILRAAERSAELTRQLLAFARQQTAIPQVLRLDAALENMIRILERLIGENIALTWDPGADGCMVRIDPSQLDQILTNLCVNARDAIKEHGRILIRTSTTTILPEPEGLSEIPPGPYAVLTVSDTGEGMDESIAKRIFEPFFTTKEVGRGTGLGLATVYGIVRQNNGCITVQSAPGRGTTFVLHFPLALEESVPDDGSSCPLLPRGEEAILLVEDEPLVLQMADHMLRSRGYEVLSASTPEEALLHLDVHGNNIRLLLTDVVMPGMNGRELAKRAQERVPGIRVLFMSGYTSNLVSQQEILPDGTGFLQKPFSMETLFTKVKECLS